MNAEFSELHARVVPWLLRSGNLYIHEFRGADFISIHQRTGEFRIVECKMEVRSVSSVAAQLDRYYDDLGIEGAKKLCVTFSTLTDSQKEEMALNNIIALAFAPSMPKGEYLSRKFTLDPFDNVFKRFYGNKTLREYQIEYYQTRPLNFDRSNYD